MASDEIAEYQAIFFNECAELLVDLQDRLDELTDGSGDEETVNAAFRAVHSIKGGAAAFGFSELIAFAHVFETVMDQIRSGSLAIGADVCALLQRAGDVIAILVEHARDGGDLPGERVERVLGELREMGGLEAPEPAAASAGAPAPEPEAELPESFSFGLAVTPADGFMRAGHDPLKMIRALKPLGLVGATAPEAIPAPADFGLDEGGLTWHLTFESEVPPETLLESLEIYTHIAEFAVIREEGDEPPPDAGSAGSGDAGGHGGSDAPAGASKAAAPAPGAEPAAAAKPEEKAAAPVAAKRDSGGAAAEKPRMQKSLRVELTRIDRLVNLVGEIVITQAVLAQKLSEIDTAGDLELGHAVENMSRQTRELQESVMAIRAQPVKSVFQRMPRVVRDLADTLKKDVRLVLSGEHTEVDTTVIEELSEPLTHMLRNSMDHGIEPDREAREAAGKPVQGTIWLSAEHRGERVIISIEDDGRGIERERVLGKAVEKGLVSPDEQLSPEEIDNLIFHPGFSTAKEISSVSGRGVGMDVVKKKIQMLGGRCTLKNTPGKGLKFMITLPLTLAVLDGMTICVGDQRFILPLSTVVEAVRLKESRVEQLPNGSRVILMRGQYMPVVSLRHALGVEGPMQAEEMAIVVDTETNGQVALIVDELIGQRQVVLKSLEANYHRVDGVSGATILGDGRVALILDVPALVKTGPGASEAMEMYH
ncbi:MAG: chemotaxis protein CheA [Pseudomonadota bacterium]